jgi:hypothetical protein
MAEKNSNHLFPVDEVAVTEGAEASKRLEREVATYTGTGSRTGGTRATSGTTGARPSAAISASITIVSSIVPATTGKAYRLEPDGTLTKHVIASITHANGLTVEVPTAAEMMKVLRQTTAATNQALILDSLRNNDDKAFEIVTEDKLTNLLGRRVGEKGVYEVGGRRVAARVKRGMQPSIWVLLDADNPEGMPDEWKALTLAERLARLEKLLPGISTCERVEYRGSSARVVKGSGAPGERTHALIRVSHPSKIEVVREYLKIETVNEDLSFPSPRYSRKDPGKTVGHEQRTLIDLAVLLSGRLVFNAIPDVSKAPGYSVVDAGIRLVNSGGGALDIGGVRLPDAAALTLYRKKAGMTVSFGGGASLHSIVPGPLTAQTEIERRGVVKTLVEWTADMKPGDKLRCETPFRASSSEAAFIKIGDDGDVFLHDVGTSTTYPLTPTFPDDQKDDERVQKTAGSGPSPAEEEAPDETDEVIIARRMPDIDPKAFYGPLATIVEAATKASEATKVGVAAQVIAQVSMCLRPFYAPLGDQRLPLNVFLLQVGPSGVGRKGTSAAFADDHLAPMICDVANGRILSFLAAADAADHDAARRAAKDAKAQIDWIRGLTPTSLAEADAEIASLQAKKKATEGEIGAYRARLGAKHYSPTARRGYEEIIAKGEEKAEDIEEQIAAIAEKRTRMADALADPKRSLDQAVQAHADATSALAALPAPVTLEPWQELFGALAEPPVTLRGVSSGEGLIYAIRDAREGQGEDEQRNDPGIAEKRLLVNLSEFGSVLALVRRPGSTLSAVIRNIYDCVTIETGAKVSPARCKEPYGSISASITPFELTGLLFDEKDLAASADNGLGNRFLYLYVARDKLVAIPAPTEGRDDLTRKVAENVKQVYAGLKPGGAFLSTPIEFTPDAEALYAREIYPRLDGLQAASANAARLFGRMTTNCRKLAAILAVINGESQISVGALLAAAAWVEYAAATVNAVASTVGDRRSMQQLRQDGEAILNALDDLATNLIGPVPARDARRKTGLDGSRFKAAVASLQAQAPSPIVVTEEDYVSGTGVKKTKSMLGLPPTPLAPDIRKEKEEV